MISVLGYELGRASRKGLNGNEKRVIRQRTDGNAVELIWALFKTDCEYGG